MTDENEQEQGEQEEHVVVGDHGLHAIDSEQQPGATGAQSAPPPSAQSGVPLKEDRDAGVQANEEFRGNSEGRGPNGEPVEQSPEGERIEQDGSRS